MASASLTTTGRPTAPPADAQSLSVPGRSPLATPELRTRNGPVDRRAQGAQGTLAPATPPLPVTPAPLLSAWDTLPPDAPWPAKARALMQHPPVRRWLPWLGVALCLAAFALLWSLMQAVPYRAVLPGLADADQQAALEALRTGGFAPRLDPASGQLEVPSARYHEARMMLAAQGLPKSAATGLEALKDQSSLTSSQFMEQVRVNAAMEQELARTILQIGALQGARVHLAQPRQSLFVRDRVPPKASVVVSAFPGRAVSAAQVQAIVHLVSSSVPYLAPEQVTVVDAQGKLLTESVAEGKLGLTAAQTQHKQQLEEMYRQRVLELLGPLVGEGNVRSQVYLQLDFTQVESTSEDYDPRDKGARTRSEALSEDRQAVARPEGVPGALANTPPARAAVAPDAGASRPDEGTTTTADGARSSRTTRNYELDRTVRHVRNAMGGVQRASVAVVINERALAAAVAASGAASGAAAGRGAWTQAELDQMLALVRGTIGYDESRGDVVTLSAAPFEAPPALDVALPWWQQEAVLQLIKTGLLGLGFIAFLLVVARPVIRQWLQPPAPLPVAEAAPLLAQGPDGQALLAGTAAEDDMVQLGEGESLEQLKAKLKPKKSSISAEMLDTANTYDDKVALVRMLVTEDSGRVASVLKNMIKVG